jgi:DNA-binding NarL/FixJ family response regulator
MASARIGVLLIADHGVTRDGLRLTLARAPQIEVRGEAGTGVDGLRLLARLARGGGVDVVVADLGLPDLGGLEVARRAKATRPAPRVLLLALWDDDEHVRGMLDAGADGYLLAHAAAAELPRGIEVVARGEIYLSPPVARRLLAQARRGRDAAAPTERERAVPTPLAGGAAGASAPA